MMCGLAHDVIKVGHRHAVTLPITSSSAMVRKEINKQFGESKSIAVSWFISFR
jgi:hypothetical protein